MRGSTLQRPTAVLEARIDSRFAFRMLRALIHEIREDDVFGMAAEMAYRFLFAIFPLLLFLVAALGFVSDAVGLADLFDRVMRQGNSFLPNQVSRILDEYLRDLFATRSSAFLTVGLIGTFWGAAGGVGTLIKGLNRAYDVERTRPFWRRQILALLVTAILPTTSLALFVLAMLGRNLAAWAGDWIGLGRELPAAIALIRWPILVLLLFFGLSLVYHVLPNTRHRYVWSLPGSAFATGCWLLLVQAFGFYVVNLGRYDATYGSLGAAIGFLLWLYLIGIVVLIGAEINALLEPTQRKHWRVLNGLAELPDQESRQARRLG